MLPKPWFPVFGWLPLTRAEAAELLLLEGDDYEWEALSVAWLGFGLSIAARRRNESVKA